MNQLTERLRQLNNEISKLEDEIKKAEYEAEQNIAPLESELSQIRQDKRKSAMKNDFEHVEQLKSKEANLKFKISAQHNRSNMLKEDLTKLSAKKDELLFQIKLEEDRIKRDEKITKQMNDVLGHYRNTRSLKEAALSAGIHFETVEQWMDWGKNTYNKTSVYFFNKVNEIDDDFKKQDALKLKTEMDSVIREYKKSKSLKEACRSAGVSYDTAQYWFSWGRNGFGEENKYFYREIKKSDS